MPSTQKPYSLFKHISITWLTWWRRQSPKRQDRLALLAPLAAVILFLAAIFAAFTYLRYEEMQREEENVRSDVEYTQQRVRLRVLERQEQSMQLADELYKGDIGPKELKTIASGIIKNFPEITSVAWISTESKVLTSAVSPTVDESRQLKTGDLLNNSISVSTFNLARELHQSIYSQPIGVEDNGEIIGIDINHIERIKKDFVNAVNNPQKISPSFYLTVEEIVISGKSILYIYVPESSQVHRCNGKIFDRNEDGDFNTL